MAVGAFAVYADSADTYKMPYEREYGRMMELSTDDTEIDFGSQETDEETQVRRAHFDEMYKYHEENGFSGGHCHDGNGGRGRGMMGRRGY